MFLVSIIIIALIAFYLIYTQRRLMSGNISVQNCSGGEKIARGDVVELQLSDVVTNSPNVTDINWYAYTSDSRVNIARGDVQVRVPSVPKFKFVNVECTICDRGTCKRKKSTLYALVERKKLPRVEISGVCADGVVVCSVSDCDLIDVIWCGDKDCKHIISREMTCNVPSGVQNIYLRVLYIDSDGHYNHIDHVVH